MHYEGGLVSNIILASFIGGQERIIASVIIVHKIQKIFTHGSLIRVFSLEVPIIYPTLI